MEPQDGALVVLPAGFGEVFLIIRVDQERERRAVRAGGRLYDKRNDVLAGGLVEVAELLAGALGVLGEVVVRSIGDALELAPAERELILDVGRAL